MTIEEAAAVVVDALRKDRVITGVRNMDDGQIWVTIQGEEFFLSVQDW